MIVEILIFIAATAAVIFLMRLFGAWMLRIDEVINNQKLLIDSLERLNTKMGGLSESQESETDLTRQELLLNLEEKFKNNEITEEEYRIARYQILNL